MMGEGGVVAAALRTPHHLPGWSLAQWEMLVRQARRADLLSRLAVLLHDRDLLRAVPPAPREHLEAALVLAEAQERDIRREVYEVTKALAASAITPVLLKGGAYLMADLPAARGRLFSDLDILVPRDRIPAVEAELMLAGWQTTHHNAYDQRYYRTWMHELPPMRHIVRQTVVDVHHAIAPLTARLSPDSAHLLEAAVPLEGEGVRVLAPDDMVLHSATHLFCNEEFGHGLRDLVDIDALVQHFSAQDTGFWPRLAARADALGLARPLYYALRYAGRMLATSVPDAAMRAIACSGRPSRGLPIMDAIFSRALEADHPLARDALSGVARRALYVRGHWLRMPPHLLALHLTVKAFRREGRWKTAG